MLNSNSPHPRHRPAQEFAFELPYGRSPTALQFVVLTVVKRVFLRNEDRKHNLGGGFKYFLCSPLFGADSHVGLFFSDGFETTNSNGFSDRRV